MVPKAEEDDLIEEVLFDEDEFAGCIGSSGHSKMGTEESTSVSTNGDDEIRSETGNRGD